MKKLFLIFALTFCLVGSLGVASARVELDPNLHPEFAPAMNLSNGNEADYANLFLQLIAGGILYLAAPTAVLFIAISGLRYTTARGEDTGMEEAKKTLTWAIIGLIVCILSFGIIKIIIGTTLQLNSTAPLQTTTAPASVATSPAPEQIPKATNVAGDVPGQTSGTTTP